MEAPFINVIMFLMTHHLYFLFVTHTTIAINRYTVFFYPTLHQRLWRGKYFKLIVAMIFVVPLPCACLRLFYTTAISEDFGVYKLIVQRSWASAAGNCAAINFSMCTSILTLFLEIRSAIAYRNFSPAMRIKHHKEYRLLMYALLQFGGQLLWSLFSLSNFLYYAVGETRFMSPIGNPETHSLIVDIICLSGSLCLFST
ncbi:hypothetical protein AAVH_39332, partial [Aphelenchoides avenae]